ncbi:hypothetical protein MJO28_009395 [Puccinia striiformis f. sp. tritici]|uniref:Uncharacterized protein n=1 Tax=Puccinia striiformis f. sp. tritici TaxID=168172 RepID=A0ACC0E7I8_9BASI|nr:hypothetical protein MJO28_009395 [Puccinia striiformis f. sp. tritici]
MHGTITLTRGTRQFGTAGLVPYFATSITMGPSTGASTLLFEVWEPIKLVNLSAERYWLGASPVALAWPTLLLPHQVALASQWAAFNIVWYADMLATSWGWTPRWYLTCGFGLTVIVSSSLLVTLGAGSYYWSLDDAIYTSMIKKPQSI